MASRETQEIVDEPYGKRLYIHDYSFQSVSPFALETRDRVTRGLMCGKVMRIVDHHLEGAGEIGLIAPNEVQRVQNHLRRRLYGDLGDLLKTLVLSIRAEGPALLMPGDSVVATCFDSGYWTFATSSSAASRMFADNEPLRRLYREVVARTGPSDLTMIRGRCLMAINRRHIDGPIQQTCPPRFEDVDQWRADCRRALSTVATSVVHDLEHLLDRLDAIYGRLIEDINGVLVRLSQDPPHRRPRETGEPANG